MKKQDIIVLGVAWLLINFMAAYGAAKLFGEHAWVYVVFMISYIYYTQNINIGGTK